MVVVVRGDAEVASWPLAGWGRPDLSVVDELARWQLTARRLGCSIRLRGACVELLELLELVGLGDVVSAVPKPPGATERITNMSIAFPGESAEYRTARDRLLEQEIELRRAMEAVAAARRELPPGGVVPEDYVFQGAGVNGSETDVRLSELFALDKDALVIYSFMFPRAPGDERPGPDGGQTALLPLAESPCPSCTAMLDQLEGAAEHVTQRVNLAAVAKAPLLHIVTFAKERGWRRLRLLSSATNTYNRDYHAETAGGSQMPMLNVFRRDSDVIRHFWASELLYAPTDRGQDPRHAGTIEPLWNIFDLTPQGRPGDWDEQLRYS